MNSLDTAEQIGAFLDRFGGLCDGVLERVVLDVPIPPLEHRAEVRVQARDTTGAWWRVTMQVRGLTEYRFVESRFITTLVLLEGVRIHRVADGLFVDLAPLVGPAPISEMVLRSEQYLIGTSMSFDAEPIRLNG